MTPGAGPPTPENRTVIIVDDEPAILETYREDLVPDHASGRVDSSRVPRAATAAADAPSYRLLVASSGEDAVRIVGEERAAGRRIAAGFFDVVMPGGIDGLETIRRVRALDDGMLCCVTTAYQDRSIEDINRLFLGHGDEWDYLSKPFTQAEVRQKARNLVSSWNRRRREEALQADLRALNDTLAERVAQKTAELRETNQGLAKKAAELERALATLGEAEGHAIQQEKLAVVGQIAAGVAHEINNPLAFILANLQTLEAFIPAVQHHAAILDSGTSPAAVASWKTGIGFDARLQEVPEMLVDCIAGARRIAAIVAELKSFGGAAADETAPVDAARAVDAALRILGNQIRHRARIERSFAEVPPVAAREGDIVQVFANLILNSLHAIPGDGAHPGNIRITTSLVREGAFVRVAVSDDGVGVAPENLGRVFDPFFTTKGPRGGTGLGLTVVRNIVRRHGGTVTIESVVGRGTTVAVELPVNEGGWGDLTPVPVPASGAPPRRLSILFVDDDASIRRSYARFFSDRHDITMAASGEEGLQAIERDSAYDVVVCDLMMPTMSGTAFFERVAPRFPPLASRFVFVTGGAFSDEARRFLDRARPRCVDKPIELRALEQVLMEAAG